MMNAKSSFFRLFAGGFAAGILAMVALQPAEATRALGEQFHITSER